MAKINFSAVLMSIEGTPIKTEKQEKMTLGAATKQSLLFFDEKESGSEKYENYCLATKVIDGGEVTIKSEEISRIKKAIGKYMGAIIVGQAWNILEGKPSGIVEKLDESPSDSIKK